MAKEQKNLQLPGSALAWLNAEERRTGASHSRIALGALLSYAALTEKDRAFFTMLAVDLEKGRIPADALLPSDRPEPSRKGTHFKSEVISELMAKRGLSLSEFAKAVGFSRSRVLNWVKGTVNPTPEALVAICNAFQVSIDSFFDKPESHKSSGLNSGASE